MDEARQLSIVSPELPNINNFELNAQTYSLFFQLCLVYIFSKWAYKELKET
jgi:hypothetical protein